MLLFCFNFTMSQIHYVDTREEKKSKFKIQDKREKGSHLATVHSMHSNSSLGKIEPWDLKRI